MISAIWKAAGSVSISTVARISPAGSPSASRVKVKTSFQSAASRWCSIFGR